MNNIPGTIVLDGNYYIDVDPYNWILKEVKRIPENNSRGIPNKRAGQRCDAVIGYFPSLDKALDGYTQQILKSTFVDSVAGINIAEVKVILQDIKNTVTRLSLTLNAKAEGGGELI